MKNNLAYDFSSVWTRLLISLWLSFPPAKRFPLSHPHSASAQGEKNVVEAGPAKLPD